MCFTALQRTDKTGKKNQREGATLSAHQGGRSQSNVTHFCNAHSSTENDEYIQSESLNSTQIIGCQYSSNVKKGRLPSCCERKVKACIRECTSVLFFLPSSSIRLWLKRSIIPSKVSFTIVWLKELIYVTVELAASRLGSTCNSTH